MALVSNAFEARKFAISGPGLSRGPNEFDGSLDEFAARHLLPTLPAVELVLDVHCQLVQYVARADPLFLVRRVRGTERRHDYRTAEGARLRATDNSPAWWLYAALRAGHRIAPDAIASVIETIPCHIFDVARRSAPVPAAAGWHIAHILNVNDRNLDYPSWSRGEVVRRFIRNVHPLNYFLLPKVDWQRLGNDPDIVDYFAAVHRKRYASIWEEFAALAQFDRRLPASPPVESRIVFGGMADRSAGEAPGPASIAPRVTRRRPALRSAHEPSLRNEDSEAARAREATVTYRATRLLFRRDPIEALPESGRFRVETPVGDFEMTKAEFHEAFPGVTASRSYREGGVYHFPSLPKRAERFRV